MSSVSRSVRVRCLAVLVASLLGAGCAAKSLTPAELTAATPSGTAAAGTTPQMIKSNDVPLGVGDTIDIDVYRHADLKRSLRIDENGKINYPLIGDVEVVGLSAFQLRSKLQEALSKYLVDPQVMVTIKGSHSQKVFVLGEVTKPGVLALEAPMSVLEAISQAGGFTLDAKNESVMLIRGNRDNPQLVKLDLERLLKQGDVSQDIAMKAGDVVYVPSTVIADVSRFSIYLKNILSPVLMVEQGIVLGDEVGNVFRNRQGQGTLNVNIVP